MMVRSVSAECRSLDISISTATGPSLAALYAETGTTPPIKVDRGRLGQIVGNLISNAIKVTSLAPHRHIRVELDVRSQPPLDGSCLAPPPPPPPHASWAPVYGSRSDSEVWIYCAVVDSGPGMSAADIAGLFARFHQLGTSHAAHGGSGLGLWICRSLVELQDGRIEAVSEGEGQGSTFRFFIKALLAPTVAKSPPQAEDVESFAMDADVAGPSTRKTVAAPPAAKAPSKAFTIPLAPGHRILVVEDSVRPLSSRQGSACALRADGGVGVAAHQLDHPPSSGPSPTSLPLSRDLLADSTFIQLTKAGAVCDAAFDGLEGLNAIAEAFKLGQPYETVLMDIEMVSSSSCPSIPLPFS